MVESHSPATLGERSRIEQAEPSVVETPSTSRNLAIRGWALPAVLASAVLIAGVTTNGFFDLENARAILANASVVGILAVAMTPITVSGNFVSLAIQQSTLLATMLFLHGLASGWGYVGAGLVVLGVLLVISLIQALIVAAGLNPVITTLAAGSILYGTVSVVSNGQVVTAGGVDVTWGIQTFLGIPIPVYLFLTFTAVMAFLADRTTVGRGMTLVGANRATAAISGLSYRAATISAFMALAIGCVLAGIILASQLGRATANDFETLTIDVAAAVLVGGTAIQGGDGSPLRSAIGALIIATLSNLMLLRDAPTGIRLMAVGGVVVLSVAVVHLSKTRSRV